MKKELNAAGFSILSENDAREINGGFLKALWKKWTGPNPGPMFQRAILNENIQI